MTDGVPIPVVSIVGKSDAGKTTLIERVVRELSSRGWRVATCKHHVHEVEVDVPGKDSWRHARAGAVLAMIASPTQFVSVLRVDVEPSLEVIAAEAARVGCDLLVTEGFKRQAQHRIEVSRRARSDGLISSPDELIAVVTDNPDLADMGVPTFGLDEAREVATFIEQTFLRR